VSKKLREWWQRQVHLNGVTRLRFFVALVLVGVSSLIIRLLMQYDFHTSALLYVGLPYLISLVIVASHPMSDKDVWGHRYRDHNVIAMVVFLASSIVLFEGFVCILFFMPIYFFLVWIVFLIHRRSRNGGDGNDGKGNIYSSLIPILILLSAFEGVSENLSFDRDSSVVVSKITSRSAAEIMDNLAQPIDLEKDRHWVLSIFPMPYEIEAGSLNAGDIHVVKTRYHRWFVTNTHEGELQLKIVEATEKKVRTQFLDDTTFFSAYLTPLGTEITLDEIGENQTNITLRIDYRRKLDPAWYFHPLQQFAVSKMADFLIDEVMVRE
jgi:hypothetical protein